MYGSFSPSPQVAALAMHIKCTTCTNFTQQQNLLLSCKIDTCMRRVLQMSPGGPGASYGAVRLATMRTACKACCRMALRPQVGAVRQREGCRPGAVLEALGNGSLQAASAHRGKTTWRAPCLLYGTASVEWQCVSCHCCQQILKRSRKLLLQHAEGESRNCSGTQCILASCVAPAILVSDSRCLSRHSSIRCHAVKAQSSCMSSW